MGTALETTVESFRNWFESNFWQRKATILMVGLDAAGKTTIMLKLKLDAVQDTVPTIGFNVETVQYKNVTFHLWDIGGQERLRKLWRHYYDGANAVIFVIDSSDIGRLGDVKRELQVLLTEHVLQDAIFLIFCNKQDLPQAMRPADILKELGIRDFSPNSIGTLLRSRQWYVQGCSAYSGIGLCEGLDWLCSHLPDHL